MIRIIRTSVSIYGIALTTEIIYVGLSRRAGGFLGKVEYLCWVGIVTDLLGMSVFDFLKANTFAPFPNSHIQSFARQLLTSVACK